MLHNRSFRSWAVAVTAFLSLTVAFPVSVRADPNIYAKTLAGTAWVVTLKGYGSGVLVDRERRLVMTNNHVVEQSDKAAVIFPDVRNGKVVSDPGHYLSNLQRLAIVGEVVFTDAQHDLAILRLPFIPARVRAVPLAAASPRPGETIHALGNSGVEVDVFGQVRGSLWRYTKGPVRQVYRSQLGFTFNGRVVENQLPLNPGDSGGPMVNERGELVALVMSGDMSRRLVSFGVDISEIRKCLAVYSGETADIDAETLFDRP